MYLRDIYVKTDMIFCFSFRNRREIAKYKAATATIMAQKCEGQELLVTLPVREESYSNPQSNSKLPPSLDNMLQGNITSRVNGEVSELKAGSIVVTWRDGNTSHLFSDPEADEDKQEEASAAEAMQMMG